MKKPKETTSSGARERRPILVGRSSRKYPIAFATSATALVELTCKVTSSAHACVIVVDATVHALYPRLIKTLKTQLGKQTSVLTVPSGEKHKNGQRLLQALGEIINMGVDRSSMIVAIGGGVTTDLAGCVSSLLLRGIRWVAVPTTFLGMVDAAIGGKTGINTEQGKNLIGTFWPPEAVLVFDDFIRTQARDDFSVSQAEAVKYFALRGTPALKALRKLLAEFPNHNGTVAEKIIRQCAKIKAQIVTADEREHGQRAFLNFGHTIGHALEYCGGYRQLSHGRAVAAGMIGALFLSKKDGMQSSPSVAELEDYCRTLASGKNIKLGDNTATDALIFDKKRRGGKLIFVLLQEIGKPYLQPAPDKRALKRAVQLSIQALNS